MKVSKSVKLNKFKIMEYQNYMEKWKFRVKSMRRN